MPYERPSSFGECYRRDLLVQLRRKSHLADPRRRQGNPAGEIDKCRGSRIARHAGTRQSVRGRIRDPFRSKGNVGASSDSPSQFHAWQRELNSGWNQWAERPPAATATFAREFVTGKRATTTVPLP